MASKRRMECGAICGLGLLVGAVQAQDKKAEDNAGFKNDLEKNSYAIGMSSGIAWKRMGVEVDMDTFNSGIKEAISASARGAFVLASNDSIAAETSANTSHTRLSPSIGWCGSAR